MKAPRCSAGVSPPPCAGWRSQCPSLFGGTMLLEFATPAHATTSSALRCQTTKLATAAKLYAGAQKCIPQSLIHATPPNPCLQTVGSKVDAAFVKADTFGTCNGTASAIRPSVERGSPGTMHSVCARRLLNVTSKEG